MLCQSFDADSITHDLSSFVKAHEVTHNMFGETILSGHEHHLTSWELEFSATKGFLGSWDVLRLGSD